MYGSTFVQGLTNKNCARGSPTELFFPFGLFGQRGISYAVYRVSLIQPRGSSLVVAHHTVDVQVMSDRPVNQGLVPVELSTSVSISHAATYVVNAHIY